MLTIFPNAIASLGQGFIFQLLNGKMLLFFLVKSCAPFHLHYKRVFWLSLTDSNAFLALDQDGDLQEVKNVTMLGLSVLLLPWNMTKYDWVICYRKLKVHLLNRTFPVAKVN